MFVIENKCHAGYDVEMKRVYMDYVAATPVCDEALRAMTATAKKFPGNPSAIHAEGRAARAVLEVARAQVAKVLVAHPDEIVFTSGSTEANNMAIFGVVRAAHARGVVRPHIIISAIEHPSVLETARYIAGENVRIDILPVDGRGLVSPRKLRKLITPETVLVSVMYANNEIGTIEPITDIAKEIRHARKMNGTAYPYFHTDSAQAANYLDINVARLGVDLMTLSSGKTYGPRGIGALFVKRGVALVPIMYGGEHEGGRRPGTESVALASGFATALTIACTTSAKESKRIQKLRDMLAEKILKKISGCTMNSGSEYCLPNILNISFDGVESDALVLYLDAAGIAVSGKSACKSIGGTPSHVMIAIGESADSRLGRKILSGEGTIRFSLGRETTNADIAQVAKELTRIIPLLRETHEQSDLV